MWPRQLKTKTGSFAGVLCNEGAQRWNTMPAHDDKPDSGFGDLPSAGSFQNRTLMLVIESTRCLRLTQKPKS